MSKNLTVEFEKDFKDQKMTLTAFNDFTNFTFEVSLINPDDEEV